MPDISGLDAAITLTQKLVDEFALTPVIGAECEFYITPAISDAELSKSGNQLKKQFPLFEKLERERGAGQLEFSLQYIHDVADLVTQYENIKKHIISAHGGAIFSPKPYTDQPASGLHLHVHLQDNAGKNVFYKKDEVMSEELEYAIAGLLDKMPEAAALLIQTVEARARILSGAIDVPNTISWGANNRSCAIRLPDKAPDNKHIEYRVAGADTNLASLISIVLEGILHGFVTKPKLQPPIFGNASDAQYALKKIL